MAAFRGLGSLGRETMLSGQRAVPLRLFESGFVSCNEPLGPTLHKITGTKSQGVPMP